MTALDVAPPRTAARIVTVAEPFTVTAGRGWFNRPYPDMGADYEAATVKDNKSGYVFSIVHDGPSRQPMYLHCSCQAPMHKGKKGAATRCLHVMTYVRWVLAK